jgi:hypothetical protein
LPSAASAASVFDDIGLSAAPVGAKLCPGCASSIHPTAVICVKCGYNFKLGRRMETVRYVEGGDGGFAASGQGGHGGHGGDMVATMMHKAAISIEEEKEAERSKTREGMPWWVYMIGLVCVIGFMVAMMLLPKEIALYTGGFVLYGIALLINTYAWIRVLIMAFSEGIGLGLMALLTPCGLGWLIYCCMRWDRCGGFVLTLVATNVVCNLIMWALEAGLGEDEDARARRPVAVAFAGFDCDRPAFLRA